MTSENPYAVSIQDVPKADGSVRWPCRYVIRVGVKVGAGNVGQVAREDPEGLVVICRPQTVGD